MGGKLLKEDNCMIDTCMCYVCIFAVSILDNPCQERLFASNYFPLVYFKTKLFNSFCLHSNGIDPIKMWMPLFAESALCSSTFL